MRKIAYCFFSVFLISHAFAADPLRIVGSSAVFPFAATIAEHYSYKTHDPMPIIEAIGTGAGIKLFCSSLKSPDGAIASRPMTRGEKKRCQQHGVTFEEVKIGLDGLVFIQSADGLLTSLSLETIKKALAEKINIAGECTKNPYKTWAEVENTLSPSPLRVLGPAPTSGTYDVLTEKILDMCSAYLRQDGIYIEAPANENLIIQRVLKTPSTIGIITFSFYEQNKSHLKAIALEGSLPSFQSIQNESYPLSRPLYLYIKTNDIKHHPTRLAYALEFTSPAAVGQAGYLTPKGLIPLSPQEQTGIHSRLQTLRDKR